MQSLVFQLRITYCAHCLVYVDITWCFGPTGVKILESRGPTWMGNCVKLLSLISCIGRTGSRSTIRITWSILLTQNTTTSIDATTGEERGLKCLLVTWYKIWTSYATLVEKIVLCAWNMKFQFDYNGLFFKVCEASSRTHCTGRHVVLDGQRKQERVKLQQVERKQRSVSRHDWTHLTDWHSCFQSSSAAQW